MPTWPTLTNGVLLEGFEETRAYDPVIRTRSEGGYTKTKIKSNRARVPMSYKFNQMCLSVAEKERLRNFEQEVKIGGTSFYWTYPSGQYTFGGSSTRFDITRPGTPEANTTRYTWDGIGTAPGISVYTMPAGYQVTIQAQNFAAGNKVIAYITDSGTDWFEVVNATGVIESDKTIGTGYIALTNILTVRLKSPIRFTAMGNSIFKASVEIEEV